MFLKGQENKKSFTLLMDNSTGTIEMFALPANTIIKKVAAKLKSAFVGYAAKNATALDATANTFTITGHGYITGLVVQVTASTTLPTGINAITDYYVINSEANKIKIAATLAKALANDPVNFTDTGTGTITITPTPLVVEIGDGSDVNGYIKDLAAAPIGYYPLADASTYAGAYCFTGMSLVVEKLYASADTIDMKITGVAKTGEIEMLVDFEVI